MKRQILRGEGIQGMCLTLSVCDMFVAGQVASELKTIIDNHTRCEEYKQTPYDQRKTTFPEGEPKRVELSEKTLDNLHKLLCKLSHESKSTLFKELDENEEKDDKGAEDDSDAAQMDRRFCVRLLQIGPTKLQVLKVIKEFNCISLKEAKDLVDAAEVQNNVIAAKDLDFIRATELQTMLLEHGATAIIISQSALQPH